MVHFLIALACLFGAAIEVTNGADKLDILMLWIAFWGNVICGKIDLSNSDRHKK